MGALFYHFGHALTGYDPRPAGEPPIASFQAGQRCTEDAFFTLLFAQC